MWARKDAQTGIVPVVISSEWANENHTFAGPFQYTGTRDFTAMISIFDAREFYESHGNLEICSYMHHLIVDAVCEWLYKFIIL